MKMYFSRVNSVVPRVFWIYQYILLLVTLVDISGILSYKISKYTIANAIYGLKVSLSNKVWLVSFKEQDDNFFWNREKSYHSKHVRDHISMMFIWKRGGEGIKSCHVFADLFFFFNLLFNFAGERVEGHTIGYFLWTLQMFDH